MIYEDIEVEIILDPTLNKIKVTDLDLADLATLYNHYSGMNVKETAEMVKILAAEAKNSELIKVMNTK